MLSPLIAKTAGHAHTSQGMQRTSGGNRRTAARNSEETWKSAEMPEVRDEEIDISYQKNQVSGVLSLLTLL